MTITRRLISRIASRIYRNNRRTRIIEKITTEEKKTRTCRKKNKWQVKYEEAENLIFINQQNTEIF